MFSLTIKVQLSLGLLSFLQNHAFNFFLSESLCVVNYLSMSQDIFALPSLLSDSLKHINV